MAKQDRFVDGKRVVGEMCECDHEKSMHGHRFAPNHGACLSPGCSCVQFTWKHFILEDGPAAKPDVQLAGANTRTPNPDS